MSSDDAYAAFLDKANAPVSAPSTKSTAAAHPKRSGGLVQLRAVDDHAAVPEEIRAKTDAAEWVYVSEADEAFVPVSLRLVGGGMPDEDEFAEMVHLKEGGEVIEIMDVVEWDREGMYKEVVDAVRTASRGGDVRVYRVPRGGTRVEYWVVTVKKDAARLVGVKALGVES